MYAFAYNMNDEANTFNIIEQESKNAQFSRATPFRANKFKMIVKTRKKKKKIVKRKMSKKRNEKQHTFAHTTLTPNKYTYNVYAKIKN